MSLPHVRFGLVAIGILCAASFAQSPIQPVTWSASASTKGELKQGGRVTLDLSADIQDGWHVYGMNQLPDGPTPMHIAVDENDAAQSDGAISGTKPVRQHDASFGLDTETYTHSLVLHVPVQLKQDAAAGNRSVPISVRFQACNDRICLPPKTVHLAVPLKAVP
jgi:DsbC/DsbD-like thiol-disulfide interchange protein